jgi:hypothetical protein
MGRYDWMNIFLTAPLPSKVCAAWLFFDGSGAHNKKRKGKRRERKRKRRRKEEERKGKEGEKSRRKEE